MDDLTKNAPPGTFASGFKPFPVPSADDPDVYLEIETIVSDFDDSLILGCQHIASMPNDEKLPCLVKYSDQGTRDAGFGTDGYAVIDLMKDAETNGTGRLLNVLRLPDGGYIARLCDKECGVRGGENRAVLHRFGTIHKRRPEGNRFWIEWHRCDPTRSTG